MPKTAKSTTAAQSVSEPIERSQATETPFNFAAYAGNVAPSKSLPYAFIYTPKDEEGLCGIFITQDNAEAVEFRPDDRWQPFSQKFGKKRTEKSGYICINPRMVVVRKSQIKVFETIKQAGKDDAAKYLGEAYDAQGQITPLGELAAQDTQKYQRRTYYLVYFVDDHNQPLHLLLVRLMTKNAFGGNFGGELKEFHKEINRVFFAAARLHDPNFKVGELDGEALALTVIDFSIAVRMSEKGSAVCYVNQRHAPALNPAHMGLSKQVSRYGGSVTLAGVDWISLFIAKDSDFGKTVVQTYHDYAEFGQDAVSEEAEAHEEEETLRPITIGGRIEQDPFGRYDADGSGVFTAGFHVTTPSGKVYYCETFGEEAEALCRNHSGWFVVKGVMGPGNLSNEPTVLVESIELDFPPEDQ
ncbi:MAG: hypothetical protein Kow00121_30400 [Elainellaceae cyanobacterium]